MKGHKVLPVVPFPFGGGFHQISGAHNTSPCRITGNMIVKISCRFVYPFAEEYLRDRSRAVALSAVVKFQTLTHLCCAYGRSHTTPSL